MEERGGEDIAPTPRYARSVDAEKKPEKLPVCTGERPGAAACCHRAGPERPYCLPGVSLTFTWPDAIFFFAASILAWMSSMKPPEVDRRTPSSLSV